MFLNSRDDFKNIYLVQKPLLQYFIKRQEKMNILMNGKDPVGEKWSFDEDNRKNFLKELKFSLSKNK